MNTALSDFRQYKARTMSARFPASYPNSGPNTIQIFSVIGAIKLALSISAILTSKSFKAAKVYALMTDSLDTTLA
jgi:hypothetical protein